MKVDKYLITSLWSTVDTDGFSLDENKGLIDVSWDFAGKVN